MARAVKRWLCAGICAVDSRTLSAPPAAPTDAPRPDRATPRAPNRYNTQAVAM